MMVGKQWLKVEACVDEQVKQAHTVCEGGEQQYGECIWNITFYCKNK